MTLDVIVPAFAFNEELRQMTVNCVESLRTEADGIILVDNFSTPPLEIPGVLTYRFYEKNQGYTGAVNAGLGLTKADIYYVVNNDMTFPPGWREALMDVFYGGFDVAVLNTNEWPGDDIREHNYMTHNFAIKRKVYNVLGELDSRYWGAWADTDYRRRCQEAGFKIGLNAGFHVNHLGSATFKAIEGDDTKATAGQDLYKEKWGDVN